MEYQLFSAINVNGVHVSIRPNIQQANNPSSNQSSIGILIFHHRRVIIWLFMNTALAAEALTPGCRRCPALNAKKTVATRPLSIDAEKR